MACQSHSMTVFKRKSALPLFKQLPEQHDFLLIPSYWVDVYGILYRVPTNGPIISHHYLRKELELLRKLYGLYDAVMSKISGYYGILWTDVDIEKINTELLEFQNR